MNLKITILLLFVFFTFVRVENMCAQFYSVHTNLIGWGTTNMNVEGSMVLSTHWSLHLPVQYNPFSLSSESKIRNLTVTPGVRYWFRESYGRGYFTGIQAIATMYNVGHVLGLDYRYEGTGVGGGISAGYSRPLSPHWNVETEVGMGILWMNYDKYNCGTCGSKVDSNRTVRLLPTKLAVNLVYLF